MLYNRQRLLLGLIDVLDQVNPCDKPTITKLMFLISENKILKKPAYRFHPDKYGPFSIKLYQDLLILLKKGLINKDNMILNENPKSKNSKIEIYPLTKLGQKEKTFPDSLIQFVSKILRDFKGINELNNFIYTRYPQYIIKSKICKNLQASNKKNNSHPSSAEPRTNYFLIGYEGKDIDFFLNQLISNEIQIVVDVRRIAKSMKFDFIGGKLANYLNKLNIGYIHIPELGIEKEFRKDLKTQADYKRLFMKYRESLKGKGEYINKIIQLGESKRIVIMCFEKDPNYCHRGQIADVLKEKDKLVVSL
ncbi:MAG: DUF488 domain-containing protein [Promethearchaeota archaeon]